MGKIALDTNWETALKFDREKLQKALRKRHQEVQNEIEEENEHLRMQILLTEIGRELGYEVFVATNDRKKSLDGKSLEYLTIPELPQMDFPQEVQKTISLIDVVWVSKGSKRINVLSKLRKAHPFIPGSYDYWTWRLP